MLVVVKKPHIEINAEEIPEELINFLTETYKNVDIINNDDELINVAETAWYRERKENSSPEQVLRRYRRRNGMSQAELGRKLGIAKQNISAMERGSRGISKKMAHELAEIFQISPGRFI